MRNLIKAQANAPSIFAESVIVKTVSLQAVWVRR